MFNIGEKVMLNRGAPLNNQIGLHPRMHKLFGQVLTVTDIVKVHGQRHLEVDGDNNGGCGYFPERFMPAPAAPKATFKMGDRVRLKPSLGLPNHKHYTVASVLPEGGRRSHKAYVEFAFDMGWCLADDIEHIPADPFKAIVDTLAEAAPVKSARPLEDALKAGYRFGISRGEPFVEHPNGAITGRFSHKTPNGLPPVPEETFITAVLDKNGQPLPATFPKLHRTQAAADHASRAMAERHPGETFCTFKMVTAFHAPKPAPAPAPKAVRVTY